MVLDAAQNFVILDRGAHLISEPPSGFPAAPKIVVVREDGGRRDHRRAPPWRTSRNRPLCSWSRKVRSSWPMRATSSRRQPPRSRAISGGWTRTTAGPPRRCWRPCRTEFNPLVFPTALAWESKHSLLVCDVGLRWRFEGDQSNRSMAEPATIFRVDLSQNRPPSSGSPTIEDWSVRPR